MDGLGRSLAPRPNSSSACSGRPTRWHHWVSSRRDPDAILADEFHPLLIYILDIGAAAEDVALLYGDLTTRYDDAIPFFRPGDHTLNSLAVAKQQDPWLTFVVLARRVSQER